MCLQSVQYGHMATSALVVSVTSQTPSTAARLTALVCVRTGGLAPTAAKTSMNATNRSRCVAPIQIASTHLATLPASAVMAMLKIQMENAYVCI